MLTKKKFIFILIAVALTAGGIGFYGGLHRVSVGTTINQSLSSEPDLQANFSTFWQTWNAIKDNFVDADQLDQQKLIYGATSGLVNALDDPHSIFFTPEEAQIFEENLSGTFEGVGMEIGVKEHRLTIISPLDNTPAQKAGLLPGDQIIQIDDQSTQNLNLEQCVQLIRGPKGTIVTLIVSRENSFQEKEFKLTRAKIQIPTVKWEFKKPDIAYIKIYHFYGNTTQEFNHLSLEILTHPSVKKIILDLRNNPGGYLNTAQEIAGWFLKPGQVVVIEQFSADNNNIFTAKGNGKLANYPIVVLINQGSASAAEILAGALRDNRQVKLIGEKSFGKGSVQEPINLEDASMLKLTIAKWLTPDGTSIDNTGLTPDIKVEMSEEDYQNNRDPQLDKAIKIIKQITL